MSTLGSRIKEARTARGMSQAALVAALKKETGKGSQGLISQLEGDINSETVLLPAIARILAVSVDWLDTGLGEMLSGTSLPVAINLEDNPDYPSIRRAKFKLSAGADGYAIENDQANGLPVVFRRDWFEMHNYKPEKMLAIRVAGASMEPSLFAGDLVIVNLAQDQPKDGNVFAVNYEGEMVIKRMVRDSGSWLLRSDNPDKARFSDKRCHEGCSVLGEIVYKQSERI